MTTEEIQEILEFFQADADNYEIASAARRQVPKLLNEIKNLQTKLGAASEACFQAQQFLNTLEAGIPFVKQSLSVVIARG